MVLVVPNIKGSKQQRWNLQRQLSSSEALCVVFVGKLAIIDGNCGSGGSGGASRKGGGRSSVMVVAMAAMVGAVRVAEVIEVVMDQEWPDVVVVVTMRQWGHGLWWLLQPLEVAVIVDSEGCIWDRLG